MANCPQQDAICIGNICLDLPLRYIDESFFRTDSSVISRIWPVLGGSAANVASILTKLGRKIRLVAAIGDDRLGDLASDYCRSNGVATDGLVRKTNVDTSLNVGLVREDGERFFVVSKQSSTFAFSLEDINLSCLDSSKILAFSSIFINPKLDEAALTEIFKAAKAREMIVCADMMRSRDGKTLGDIQRCMPYIDYFLPNESEVLHLTQKKSVIKACEALIDAGVKAVIVKKGRRGALVAIADQVREYPAFAVTAPVDTIGAGDNFMAGFLDGLLDGRSMDECVMTASAVASLSIRAEGATNGVKSKAQVREFIKDNSRWPQP